MVSLKNKAVVIIIVLLAILTAGISYLYFSKTRLLSPVGTQNISVTPVPAIVESLSLWEDQSEFSFSYPSSLIFNPHDEDTENYAHVELTSATHSGNLIVWTQDTKASDNDDWIKKEKIQGSIDTTLADLPAKKFLSGNETKSLTTVVIRNGYLYKVEAKLTDSDFWNKIYETVSTTFKFRQNQDTVEQEVKPQNQAPVYDEPVEVFDEVVE